MARTRTPKTCQFCGASNLFWKKMMPTLSAPAGAVHLHNPDGTQHGGPGGTCPNWGNKSTQSGVGIQNGGIVITPPVSPAVPHVPPTPQPASDASLALYGMVEPHVVARIKDELSVFTPAETAISHVYEVHIVDADGSVDIHADLSESAAHLLQLVSAGLHVMIVGPAGCGKTYAAKIIAGKIFGVDADSKPLRFYPFSVGPQTSKSDLMGYTNVTDGQYISTPFRKALEFGGLFLLDEVDAGNAGVLTILNAALSGAPCVFPDGVTVYPHAEFVCIASANTFGHGATAQYAGRNKLDGATLDRFAGISWDYDRTVEAQIVAKFQEPACVTWMQFVHALRDACTELRMMRIFGTRRIQQGAALLASGMPWEKVAEATVWFGVSVDDRRKLASAVLAKGVSYPTLAESAR